MLDHVSVSESLARIGGVAPRSTLVKLTSRAAVDRAIRSGEAVRLGRGRYAVPGVDHDLAVAVTLGGAVSHTSAALRHGWALKQLPDKPHVTVSRGRHLDPGDARSAHVHVAELGSRDVVDGITTPEVTLTATLRSEPFDSALAIADSAIRCGFGVANLARIADLARGPGSGRLRLVARHASPRAANPFESVLRAIWLDVPGLDVEPQVSICDGSFSARPDLVDRRLRIVLEADSFEWHGGRRQLASDARRYNRLVVAGYLVLRFSWEDVMLHPGDVHDVLVAAVALAEALSERTPRRHSAA
jgi:very-short-patch-repair endonuclease